MQQVSTQSGPSRARCRRRVCPRPVAGPIFTPGAGVIPFVIGFALGPIGYYLRRKVAETPAFERAGRAAAPIERSPFLPPPARDYRVRMLQAFGLSIIGCIANFIFVVYLVAYMINTMKLPPGRPCPARLWPG